MEESLNVSVCIITRDEAVKLDRCLKSLAPLKLDVVVVDTGSTDNTKEIIENNQVRGADFLWQDNFSAARNYALACAKYDNVLVVDSDEWFAIEDCAVIKNEITAFLSKADLSACVGTFERYNQEANGTWQVGAYPVTRLFSRKYFHYIGKVHEAPMPRNQQIKRIDKPLAFHVYHDGYTNQEVFAQKAQRNLLLLLKERGIPKEKATDPYVLCQVAQLYQQTGRKKMALLYYKQWLLHETSLEQSYFQVGLQGYLETLIELKQFDVATKLLDAFGMINKDADNYFLTGLIYSEAKRFEEAKIAFEKATSFSNARVQARCTTLAQFMLGSIAEIEKNYATALKYYQQAGKQGREAIALLQEKHDLAQFKIKQYLALDVGQTTIKQVILDEFGNTISKRVILNSVADFDEEIQLLKKTIEPYRNQIVGIAICIFGMVDSPAGVVNIIEQDTTIQYPIEKLLTAEFKVPVVIQNDAKAALIGEKNHGSLNGETNAAVITLGTAVGGSIMLNGQLFQGAHKHAGEISYMVQQDKFLGESLSAVGLMQKLYKIVNADKAISDKKLFAQALANPQASELIEAYSLELVFLLLNIQSLYDLEKIVIGGGLGQELTLIKLVEKKYQALTADLPLYQPQIVPAQLGNLAGIYGAFDELLKRQG